MFPKKFEQNFFSISGPFVFTNHPYHNCKIQDNFDTKQDPNSPPCDFDNVTLTYSGVGN